MPIEVVGRAVVGRCTSKRFASWVRINDCCWRAMCSDLMLKKEIVIVAQGMFFNIVYSNVT